jgi:hypothetical protein
VLAWLADRDTTTTFAAFDLFLDYLVSITRPAA